MRILYPYNEILPKQRAHDVFIFHECSSLAKLGNRVTLLCGKGSKTDKALFQHYGVSASENLSIKKVPIVRKNNPFNLSWNLPFFFFSQQFIQKHLPDFVLLSVLKQGSYHLSRKIPKVRYIYEVHELSYYPGYQPPNSNFYLEQVMLKKADLITVTTSSLKKILEAPPYSLRVPIAVIPLAVHQFSLPPPPKKSHPLTLMYVGQLYSGQGLADLLAAMKESSNVCLKIIGGSVDEVHALNRLAKKLGVSNSVEFLGFQPPSKLPEIVKEAHAFVAPFENRGRMPFVAHTKLLEYAVWGRPIIAPNLPVVQEHLPKAALLFEPENVSSLANCIKRLQKQELREELQKESLSQGHNYSWKARALRYQELFQRIEQF